ncbi:hypothetical protein CBL_13835 [Carabus blaptoides fortunei]
MGKANNKNGGRTEQPTEETSELMIGSGDTKISDNEKWPALQQILQRYLHFAEQTRKPLEIPITEQSYTPELTDNIEEIVNLVPKTYRNKAVILLRKLQSDGTVSWNELGELVVDKVGAEGEWGKPLWDTDYESTPAVNTRRRKKHSGGQREQTAWKKLKF